MVLFVHSMFLMFITMNWLPNIYMGSPLSILFLVGPFNNFQGPHHYLSALSTHRSENRLGNTICLTYNRRSFRNTSTLVRPFGYFLLNSSFVFILFLFLCCTSHAEGTINEVVDSLYGIPVSNFLSYGRLLLYSKILPPPLLANLVALHYRR